MDTRKSESGLSLKQRISIAREAKQTLDGLQQTADSLPRLLAEQRATEMGRRAKAQALRVESMARDAMPEIEQKLAKTREQFSQILGELKTCIADMNDAQVDISEIMRIVDETATASASVAYDRQIQASTGDKAGQGQVLLQLREQVTRTRGEMWKRLGGNSDALRQFPPVGDDVLARKLIDLIIGSLKRLPYNPDPLYSSTFF